MMGADPGASAFPNDDNLFEWTATLCGSEDTAVRHESLARMKQGDVKNLDGAKHATREAWAEVYGSLPTPKKCPEIPLFL